MRACTCLLTIYHQTLPHTLEKFQYVQYVCVCVCVCLYVLQIMRKLLSPTLTFTPVRPCCHPVSIVTGAGPARRAPRQTDRANGSCGLQQHSNGLSPKALLTSIQHYVNPHHRNQHFPPPPGLTLSNNGTKAHTNSYMGTKSGPESSWTLQSNLTINLFVLHIKIKPRNTKLKTNI